MLMGTEARERRVSTIIQSQIFYHESVFIRYLLFLTIASFFVHVRGGHVIALQNVKDHNSWLRIKNNKLEGNVCSVPPSYTVLLVCLLG